MAQFRQYYGNEIAKACIYCGKAPKFVSADHYIPKSRGGPGVVPNLVPACSDCNHIKADMLPLEFVLFRLGFLVASERCAARPAFLRSVNSRDSIPPTWGYPC